MKFYKKFYVSEDVEPITLNPCKVYNSIKSIAFADQESFWLIGYNGINIEIYRECIFLGGMESCSIDNKIIFKRLLMHDCPRFITIHNHPGGATNPSDQDIHVTKQILFAAEALNMKYMDHLIIADTGFFSFHQKGIVI